MANCNKHFKDYNGKIRLTESRRESLKGSRKELRQKVKKWFKENVTTQRNIAELSTK